MAEDILQRLLAANDPAEKAALVARFALTHEEPVLAELIPVLAFLRWFDEPVVAALLPEGERPRSAELFASIIELPFVERVSYGYALHDLTRQGLLAETTAEQRMAAAKAADVYLREDTTAGLLESLYCTVLGEQSEAANARLAENLFATANRSDWNGLLSLFGAILEAETLVEREIVTHTALHWFAQGLARHELGNLTAAIADYDRAIELNPEDAIAYYNRGIARRAFGDLAGAVADYDQALSLSPEFAKAYNNRGLARRDLGDLTGAVADYEQAFSLNPELATAYNNRDIAHRADQQASGGRRGIWQEASKYNIIIHGNAYGLAVGDNARVSQRFGSEEEANTPPFIVPALPPQGIIGRDEILTQIHDLLGLDSDTAEVPPVALYGMGGIGKTALAISLGRMSLVQERFPDGVLWASVGPTPTIRLLLNGWAQALDVDLLSERDEQACKERLHAILYHRRVLLLVDDVWEVLHGQHFNIGGPACRTLFTTREIAVAHALASQERTLRVDVLKPEDALTLLQRLAPEAVMADRENAMRLCERVKFLPLALTLAGRLLADEADIPARMQGLVGDLIERQENRFQLLQAEGRLGISGEELVSLQAILELSVEQLDTVDQERFAMSSIFGQDPLTWEIYAASFVWGCSVEEATDSVARFIQRGLVERRGGRYCIHALLADYAARMMEEWKL